jgi:photosystem II stability/assembly factor-like uncharacterized protein
MSRHRFSIQVGACIATAVTALAASGCGSQAVHHDREAASGSGAAASSPAAAPTAAPVRSPAGVWLDSLQMVSATTGWALLSTSNPDDNSALQLGRTTDGGRTWALVTPPAPTAALGEGILLKAVDPQRAWLAAAPSANAGGTTVVFRTVDSGRSWQRSAPIPANQPVAIVVSGQRGWLLESLGAAMGSNPVRVYRTTDGGLRWSPLAASPKPGTTTTAGDGLQTYCDKTGLAFGSALLGWVTAQCNGGYSVQLSRDGGARWSRERLPIPAAACEPDGCTTQALLAASGTTILELEHYPTAPQLLISADGGSSWRTEAMPAGAGPYPRVEFFGAADAIAQSAGPQGSVGRTFFVTSDGGLSWTAVPQGRHFGKGGASFDFISPAMGFAWLNPGVNAASLRPKVYRTSDSGRAWTSFVPRLG